ncbi:hypothetical protein [Actinokineospora inagensis]|uniref:hypothetical protein n=1 Tax=Actinokineospora inagensis TaxID=103730 RepID=UPI00040B89AD|nr:hypothetical protein [Actinokineospora inagensis]
MAPVGKWTGREAGALRSALRLTIRAFADHLGVAERTVAKWESLQTGTSPWPETQAILDRALSRADADAKRRFEVLLREGVTPSRRRSGRDVIDQAAQRAVDFDQVLAATSVDDFQVDLLCVHLAELATAYVHTPVGDVIDDIAAAQEQAFALIRRGLRPRQLCDAYIAAGIGCLLLAAASQNLGRTAAAHTQLRTAYKCAEAADSDALRAWARGSTALTLEWGSSPASALRYLDTSAAGVATQTHRRALALEARISARIGDPARAHQALRRLDDLLDSTELDDEVTAFGGIFTFPASKAAYYRAGTHDLLGEFPQARTHALDALDRYAAAPGQEHSYGDLALTRVIIADTHLGERDLDGAEAALAPLRLLDPRERIAQLPTAVARTHRMIAKITDTERATSLLGDLSPTRPTGIGSAGPH